MFHPDGVNNHDGGSGSSGPDAQSEPMESEYSGNYVDLRARKHNSDQSPVAGVRSVHRDDAPTFYAWPQAGKDFLNRLMLCMCMIKIIHKKNRDYNIYNTMHYLHYSQEAASIEA